MPKGSGDRGQSAGSSGRGGGPSCPGETGGQGIETPLGKGNWKGAESPKEQDLAQEGLWGTTAKSPARAPMRGFLSVRPFVLPPSSTEHPKLGPGGVTQTLPGSPWSEPLGLGTAQRAWAGGRMVKAGAGMVSRAAGLRPGGGSRRYLWRRPAKSRNSSDLAKLSPTQTRRPAEKTEARGGGSRPALCRAVPGSPASFLEWRERGVSGGTREGLEWGRSESKVCSNRDAGQL